MNPRWRTSATPGSGAISLLEQPGEELDLRRELLDRALALERLERGDPGGAAEWVPGVGVAVKEAPVVLVTAEESLVESLGGERRGEREVAAGDPFPNAQQIRDDVLVLAGEHPAGPSEAGRDLVADEQHAVFVAQLTDPPQIAVRLHEHARGALDERFDDHRGDRLAMLGEQAREVRGITRAGRDGVEQQRAVDGVEQVDATDRHRPERVPVVRVLQADELRALRLALLRPPLERHLQRHLDGGGAAVGVEHARETGRGDRDEPFGELDRRLVREAEHRRVGDAIELTPDRLIERRVAMSVDVAPQRGDAVDIRVALGVEQRCAVARGR